MSHFVLSVYVSFESSDKCVSFGIRIDVRKLLREREEGQSGEGREKALAKV